MSPMPSKNMSAVINRKRYSVKDATLIASDYYWDGSNWERHGRNTFLYRGKNGSYFVVRVTQWQGELDKIEPIEPEEAEELYEELPEKEVEFSKAFPHVKVEDA